MNGIPHDWTNYVSIVARIDRQRKGRKDIVISNIYGRIRVSGRVEQSETRHNDSTSGSRGTLNGAPLTRATVTVLMPVYNGEKYLREAIESILGQTYTDFEFLIINDGSTDQSVQIIRSYNDQRIRLVENETNLGLIWTLNKGIDLARGEYIARMDADDISLPERLAKQLAFMDSHPDVGVCGSWAEVIDINGSIIGKLKSPVGNAVNKLYWRPSPFIHPTCMIRADLLRDNKYSPDYQHAEDYELWLRLFRKTVFFNIDQFLLLYRKHSGSITKSKRELQLANSYRAFNEHIGIEIGYTGFLDLISVETKMNPLKRAYYLWIVSRRTGFSFMLFIMDNLIYFKLWLRGIFSGGSHGFGIL